MIYHSIVGFILWVLATLAFRFYGQMFFYPDILAISVLFIVAGPLLWGFMVVYLGVLKVLPENRALAAIGFVLPGMALDSLVAANFGLVFPNLDMSLDGLFGSLMLWSYGALLFGGYSSDRRAKRRAARLLLERASGE